MKRMFAIALLTIFLLPGIASAGSATDAALGLGAFAALATILLGAAALGQPAIAAPPVVVEPPPPPVVYAPAPPVYGPPPVVYGPPPPPVYAPPTVYAPPPVVYAPRPAYGHRPHWRYGHVPNDDGYRWRRY